MPSGSHAASSVSVQHFVRNVPALHDVLVLVNVRHVPVSTVLPDERVLVSALPGFSGLAAPLWSCPQPAGRPGNNCKFWHAVYLSTMQNDAKRWTALLTRCVGCRLYRVVVRFG